MLIYRYKMANTKINYVCPCEHVSLLQLNFAQSITVPTYRLTVSLAWLVYLQTEGLPSFVYLFVCLLLISSLCFSIMLWQNDRSGADGKAKKKKKRQGKLVEEL